MVPPSTVPCNDDVGRFVSLSEDMVVGSYDVLQCSGKSIFRNRSETVARRDEDTFACIPSARGDITE